MSRRGAGHFGAGIGGAALVLLVAGCNVTEAKVWNLRELHSSDPTQPGVRVHRRHAAVMKDWEFVLRGALTISTLGVGPAGKEEKPIKDPYGACLDNLTELGDIDPERGEAWAKQAELFAWLAVDDDFVLSRERAALELGELAARLGLERAPVARPEGPAVDPEALSQALAAVVAASNLGGGSGAEGRREALATASAGLRALALDREGARRALALTTILADEASRGSADFAPLFELQAQLARDLVEWSLAAALTDPHPFVRSAAVRACAELPAPARTEVWLAALDDPAWEVRHEVLRCVRERGLPATETEERERWLAALVEATEARETVVQVAACGALGAVSQSGLTTLRAEEWRAWWDETAAPVGQP